MTSARYIIGDVHEVLASLEPGSVDMVMSSPPFLALRSYLPADHPDKGKEIGSEATPADFIDALLDVAEACARVLAPHGSLVFELGDTYAGSDTRVDSIGPDPKFPNRPSVRTSVAKAGGAWPLDKSLCGIPTLFAWSLAYGRNLLRPERTTPPWRIRNVVAWCRPNPPVGALGDKVRPATSYLTVACKARNRYFDLDAVRAHPDDVKDKRHRTTNGPKNHADPSEVLTAGAPPLDYWVIPTQPYDGAHYATYPEKLCEIPVKAMCPLRVCTTCGEPSRRIAETVNAVGHAVQRAAHRHNPTGAGDGRVGVASVAAAPKHAIRQTTGWTDCGHNAWRNGVVLDCFGGSGTTLAVATGHGRDAIGIDIDARNADLALDRVGPLMLTVERHAERKAS